MELSAVRYSTVFRNTQPSPAQLKSNAPKESQSERQKKCTSAPPSGWMISFHFLADSFFSFSLFFFFGTIMHMQCKPKTAREQSPADKGSGGKLAS